MVERFVILAVESGRGCWGGDRWWLRRCFSGPDELAVPIPLRENTHEAWLLIEHASDVCVSGAGIAPGCVDGDAHLVFVEVGSPAIEAPDACGGAARDFVQVRALGCVY